MYTYPHIEARTHNAIELRIIYKQLFLCAYSPAVLWCVKFVNTQTRTNWADNKKQTKQIYSNIVLKYKRYCVQIKVYAWDALALFSAFWFNFVIVVDREKKQKYTHTHIQQAYLFFCRLFKIVVHFFFGVYVFVT